MRYNDVMNNTESGSSYLLLLANIGRASYFPRNRAEERHPRKLDRLPSRRGKR